MANIENTRSIFLANAFPRLLTSGNANILLGVSAPLFYVGTDSNPNIPEITISAQLIALDGIVKFNCVGGTLTSVANNSATLTYANMSADIATITATLAYRGVTFTSKPVKITKVQAADGTQGSNGLSNSVVYAYQRSATVPTGSPGDITYNFASGAIVFPTTLANGWSKVIPAGTDPLYVTTASASSSASTDSIAGTEWSSPVILAQNGTQGLSVATIYIYQRTASNTTPPLPGTSSVFTFSSGAITGLTNGWTSAVPAASAGGYLWVSTATASNTTPTDTILSSEWAAAQLLSQDGQGVGTPGANGNSVATATLYQWSTVLPANPTGTATLTWTSGATTAYSGNDGWYISAPANPGSPGIKLFIASTQVTAPAGTTSSTATFGSAQIVALSQNGAAGTQGVPGLKTANVYAYQWSLSGPTTTGTATYNWFLGTYDTPPATGWSINKTNAPGSGYTLYEASVRLVDSTGSSTSNIDWSMANVAGIAYQGTSGGAGSQGASAKRAYVLINGSTLAQSPTFVTRPGTAFPVTGTWGETNDWQATPPTPAAGQAVFQADGIFDPVTNQTVWNVPYLSNLKVGSLSALTLGVLGSITSGSMDIGSGSASWHVDSSGNQWAGATTYAAAPFKVSNTGNMIVTSLLVKNEGGSIILDPSGLKAGFEAPGTKNSDLTPNINAASSRGTALNTDPAIENPTAWSIGGNITVSIKDDGTKFFRSQAWALNGEAETAKLPIDPSKTYSLSADVYQDGFNDRYMFLFIQFFDANGNYLGNAGWGGGKSGYAYGGIPPAGWSRQGVQIGTGTARTIPTNARQCSIGVWLNYDGSGSTTTAVQGAQNIRLEPVISKSLISQSFQDEVDAKLSRTSASDLAATITVATGGSILAGTTQNGAYMSPSGFYGVVGGTVKFSIPIGGDPTFGGTLTAPSGTLGNLYVAGSIWGGDYTEWAWPADPTKGGYAFGSSGALFGNYNSGKYFQIFSNGNISAPGFSLTNGQLTLTSPVIVNPNISGFTPTIPAMSATLSGGPITSSGPSNQTRNLGTRQITTTGGVGPYTYAWTTTMLEGGGASNYFTLSGADTDTVTVTVKGGVDVSLIANITGTVTGGDGRSATKAFRVTANFGAV